MARRAYTDAEVEAAVQAISDPARLDEAQRVVAGNASSLQRILNQALDEADWFGAAHQAQVADAAGREDAGERALAVRTLLVEETRVSMLIGVAVGYELAHELIHADKEET